MVEQYTQDHPITEEEKKEHYEKNERPLLEPAKIHMAEMTLKIPPHDESVMYDVYKAEEDAKTRAFKAIQRVKSGESFAEVAREMSESPTAKDGGDLGLVEMSSDKIPRIVTREAFILKPGEVGEKPVKYQDAYYVYINYDKPERKKLPYDDPETQNRIQRSVLTQKRNTMYREHFDQLVDPEKIEILYEDFYTVSPMRIESSDLNVPGEG